MGGYKSILGYCNEENLGQGEFLHPLCSSLVGTLFGFITYDFASRTRYSSCMNCFKFARGLLIPWAIIYEERRSRPRSREDSGRKGGDKHGSERTIIWMKKLAGPCSRRRGRGDSGRGDAVLVRGNIGEDIKKQWYSDS